MSTKEATPCRPCREGIHRMCEEGNCACPQRMAEQAADRAEHEQTGRQHAAHDALIALARAAMYLAGRGFVGHKKREEVEHEVTERARHALKLAQEEK